MDSENNTYMGNGIFCEEVEEMEDKRNRITDFLDSLDEDKRAFNTDMGNGMFRKEVKDMEDGRSRIADFLDSLDEDKRKLLEIGVGLATIFVLGYGCYSLGVHIGKRAMVKEIDHALNSCLDVCKNEGQGVLLNMSTKKHKNFNVYICK